MQVTTERASWILDYFRSHGTVVAFGGRILGEDAVSEALVSYVWPESRSIGMKLLSEESKQSWDRLNPLSCATFSLVQRDDPEFEGVGRLHFHSVLIADFPDGTTIFLAPTRCNGNRLPWIS